MGKINVNGYILIEKRKREKIYERVEKLVDEFPSKG